MKQDQAAVPVFAGAALVPDDELDELVLVELDVLELDAAEELSESFFAAALYESLR